MDIHDLITTDNVALLSVVITLLMFIFSRLADVRYKKHEDKKVQYIKLINFMNKTMQKGYFEENEEGEIKLTEEQRAEFFDVGSSLLLYGSKKIYRKYVFFREFTTNPLIQRCIYYRAELIIFIMADILRSMRKEVGLSLFNSINENEALAFFVNDLTNNPEAKKKEIDARFYLSMLRFELFCIDRVNFIWLRKIINWGIRPIFASVKILLKYMVVMPIVHAFHFKE